MPRRYLQCTATVLSQFPTPLAIIYETCEYLGSDFKTSCFLRCEALYFTTNVPEFRINFFHPSSE